MTSSPTPIERRKLNFLESCHIQPPPNLSSLNTILELYKLKSIFEKADSTNLDVTHTRKHVHIETIGMLLSVTAMVITRILRSFNASHNFCYPTYTGNITEGISNTSKYNPTNTSCFIDPVPICQPYEDTPTLLLLGSLSLFSLLLFTLILGWRNISYAIFARIIKNAHMVFVLFLLVLVAILELGNSLSPFSHQLLFTGSYLVAFTFFLMFDMLKNVPHYAVLYWAFLVILVEGMNIYLSTRTPCCEIPILDPFMSNFQTLSYSSWMKTLHFNILVATVPSLVSIITDYGRRNVLYYVIIHPLRHQINRVFLQRSKYKRRRSSNKGVDLVDEAEARRRTGHKTSRCSHRAHMAAIQERRSSVKEMKGGDSMGEHLNSVGSIESMDTAAACTSTVWAAPKTMKSYDVQRGIRLLTLVGLPRPAPLITDHHTTLCNNQTNQTNHTAAAATQRLKSTPSADRDRDSVELRKRVWKILVAYNLERDLWENSTINEYLSNDDDGTQCLTSQLDASAVNVNVNVNANANAYRECGMSLGHRHNLYVVLLMLSFVAGALLYALSPTWDQLPTTVCGVQIGIKVVDNWFVVASCLLSLFSCVVYGLILRNNCHLKSFCTLITNPNIIMVELSMVGLLCIDVSTPETNVTWINSITYINGIQFFILSDIHQWRYVTI